MSTKDRAHCQARSMLLEHTGCSTQLHLPADVNCTRDGGVGKRSSSNGEHASMKTSRFVPLLNNNVLKYYLHIHIFVYLNNNNLVIIYYIIYTQLAINNIFR